MSKKENHIEDHGSVQHPNRNVKKREKIIMKKLKDEENSKVRNHSVCSKDPLIKQFTSSKEPVGVRKLKMRVVKALVALDGERH